MVSDRTGDAIGQLRENAANEQVERLLDVIEAQQQQIDQLEETVYGLENDLRRVRARAQASDTGVSSSDEPLFDQRDQAVLDAIVENEYDSISVSKLRRLYKKHTDVRQSETLRDRVRHLVENGPFEKSADREWEFLPET